ncbi:MAG: restriction endonuclease [candidate division WOR-3 bacterium]
MRFNETEKKINSIIAAYNKLVGNIESEALNSEERAYGGIIRAGKGKLVESIGKALLEIAAEELNINQHLRFVNKTIKIPLKHDYINRIKNPEVKDYISKNLDKIFYRIKPDIQVYLDDEFKISIECKAYTEIAMLKRILVDCTLIKQIFPNVSFVLLQLESQLGGDYSQYTLGKFGSHPTHTLFSYFDVDLTIITLLKGERKVDQPIHKPKYFKPLERQSLIEAINCFKNLLLCQISNLNS